MGAAEWLSISALAVAAATLVVAVLTLYVAVAVPERLERARWYLAMRRSVNLTDNNGQGDESDCELLKESMSQAPYSVPRRIISNLNDYHDLLQEFYRGEGGLRYREDISPLISEVMLEMSYEMLPWRRRIRLYLARRKHPQKDWTRKGFPPGSGFSLTPRALEALAAKKKRAHEAYEAQYRR